ncbi:hypothetical protein ABG067_006046 [Albugo candida]|uniref:Succinate dehydrogenase assembly factor 2, mitochondrial n=1 Tax=Albugo candida TaxID=65357 RepID=A0A024GU89_9STRA|nr:unnamed protein product [Albugo candida]|eukprot:CCI50500.1 unnamed protein product [Albugo candida]
MHVPRRLFRNQSGRNVYKRCKLSLKAGSDAFHLTEEQEARVVQRDQEIRKQHLALPKGANDSAKIARKKRLLYRSRQRGWLEVDLLLGSWTQKNIDGLQEGELNDFEAILNQETIDIYNYITKQRPIPSELDTNVLHRLQEYCANSPLGKASMDGYTHNKRFMSN